MSTSGSDTPQGGPGRAPGPWYDGDPLPDEVMRERLDELKAYLADLAAEEEAERAAGLEAPPPPEVALALPVPPEDRVRQTRLWQAKLKAREEDDALQAARLEAEHGDPLLPAEARAEGWTSARLATFLERLAQTGSVAAAARRVGMAVMSAYRLRDSAHPAFARAWKQATRVAYLTLRDAAMERAIAGRVVPLYSGGAVVGEQTVYDERLVVFLLKTRGGRRVSDAMAPAGPGETPVREYVRDGLYEDYAMSDFARSLALFQAPDSRHPGPDQAGPADPPAAFARKLRPGPRRGSRNRRKPVRLG